VGVFGFDGENAEVGDIIKNSLRLLQSIKSRVHYTDETKTKFVYKDKFSEQEFLALQIGLMYQELLKKTDSRRTDVLDGKAMDLLTRKPEVIRKGVSDAVKATRKYVDMLVKKGVLEKGTNIIDVKTMWNNWRNATRNMDGESLESSKKFREFMNKWHGIIHSDNVTESDIAEMTVQFLQKTIDMQEKIGAGKTDATGLTFGQRNYGKMLLPPMSLLHSTLTKESADVSVMETFFKEYNSTVTFLSEAEAEATVDLVIEQVDDIRLEC